jgi:hypothetical protein
MKFVLQIGAFRRLGRNYRSGMCVLHTRRTWRRHAQSALLQQLQVRKILTRSSCISFQLYFFPVILLVKKVLTNCMVFK